MFVEALVIIGRKQLSVHQRVIDKSSDEYTMEYYSEMKKKRVSGTLKTSCCVIEVITEKGTCCVISFIEHPRTGKSNLS